METNVDLIKTAYTADSIGQQVATETRTTVPATVTSATRNEWVSAGQNNYRADLVATTPLINYSGERIAEVDGVRYAVYRVFRDEDTDLVELYMQEEGGVRG